MNSVYVDESVLTEPFLDHHSKSVRDNAEFNARFTLKELQKTEPKFRDPVTAAKHLAESKIACW